MFLKTNSIKKKLRFSYILIIFLMIFPTFYSVIVSKIHTMQYDKIITNVSRANRLNQIIKVNISDEIWDIVAGKKEFKDGKQYQILKQIRSGISDMMESTANEKNRQLLVVASRTEKTLENYVNILGEQISRNASVEENEKIMDEIRGVSSLMYDILQNFIVSEIESAADTNESIKRSSINLSFIQLGISVCIIIISIYAFTSVSENIRRPIHDMERLSSRIAEGDLDARAELPRVQELDHLADNLNTMAGKIKGLIDENVAEQQNLQKAEMKTLQAQITPHFLYNTFDTIIWLAESGKTDEVIEITRAFSDFFRISLSKGHEWITVSQELDHVRNYLKIQKIRYENILSYEFDVDEGIDDFPVLKLVLQPLVENAIYHGIKNKRGRGKIIVRAHLLCDRTESSAAVDALEYSRIEFSVEDNGIGFTQERLKEVLDELSRRTDIENLKSVYGLYNVNKRLNLYYDESVSLNIQSEYGKGARVSFIVPADVNLSGDFNV
jgi:two-component system, sensor histidine kinase YesM